MVKINESEVSKPPAKKDEETELSNLGLPQLILTHQEQQDNGVTWEQAEDKTYKKINHSTIMCPYVVGEKLERIYVNMDSTCVHGFKPKNPNENNWGLPPENISRRSTSIHSFSTP